MRPRLRIALAALAVSAASAAPPATAQTSLRIALQTDYRLRGYSLSAGDPVAIADIGHELGSGFYVNAAGLAVLDDGPAILGGQANIGYARRIGGGASIDLGLTRSEYSSRSAIGRSSHYSEAYAGIAVRNLSARLSVSPDYFAKDATTLYAEAEATFRLDDALRLNLHAGLLNYVGGRPAYVGSDTEFDWRVGASRQLGPVHLFLNLSGSDRESVHYLPYPPYAPYAVRTRNRVGLVAGISHSF